MQTDAWMIHYEIANKAKQYIIFYIFTTTDESISKKETKFKAATFTYIFNL